MFYAIRIMAASFWNLNDEVLCKLYQILWDNCLVTVYYCDGLLAWGFCTYCCFDHLITNLTFLLAIKTPRQYQVLCKIDRVINTKTCSCLLEFKTVHQYWVLCKSERSLYRRMYHNCFFCWN